MGDGLHVAIELPKTREQSTQTEEQIAPINPPARPCQGNIIAALGPLNCAINGSGFFIVQTPDGKRFFTRDGQFSLIDGKLINSNGYNLIGFITDNENNTIRKLDTINFNHILQKQATTKINLNLNLSASSTPPIKDFPIEFTKENSPTFHSYSHLHNFAIYDSLGAEHQVVLYFIKAPAERTWYLHIGIDGKNITPKTSSGLVKPFTLVFEPWGILQDNFCNIKISFSPDENNNCTTTSATTSPTTNCQIIDIDLSKTTQCGNLFMVNEIQQNGLPSIDFQTCTINPTGNLTCTCSNGMSVNCGQIILANFNALQRLHLVKEKYFVPLLQSGDAIIGEPGTSSLGLIQQGALEEILPENDHYEPSPFNEARGSSTIGFSETETIALLHSLFPNLLPGSPSCSSVSSNSLMNTIKVREFTQGEIILTNSPLDLAIINGFNLDVNSYPFFIVENEHGEKFYTREGDFVVNGAGYIVDSHCGNKVIGFVTDSNANITKTLGPIRVNTTCMPTATSCIKSNFNLNVDSNSPAAAFPIEALDGVRLKEVPSTDTYNSSFAIQTIDSLGKQHILTMYMVKKEEANKWQMFIDIEGSIECLPETKLIHVKDNQYVPIKQQKPKFKSFAIAFDSEGKYIPSRVELLQQSTDEIQPIITNISDIENDSFIKPTIFDFIGGKYPIKLYRNDFIINGIPIIGVAQTVDELAALINSHCIADISAKINHNSQLSYSQLRLISTYGRNIHIQVKNQTSPILNFSNLLVARYGLPTLGEINRAITKINNSLARPGLAPDYICEQQEIMKKLNLMLTLFYPHTLIKKCIEDFTCLKYYPHTSPFYIDHLIPGQVDLNCIHYPEEFASPCSDETTIGFCLNNGALPQVININLTECTQISSPFAITSITHNGYCYGRVTVLMVDPHGIVTAGFGNGMAQQLGQIALAKIKNPNKLTPETNNTWSTNANTGEAKIVAANSSDLPGVSIQSGSLEDIRHLGYDRIQTPKLSESLISKIRKLIIEESEVCSATLMFSGGPMRNKPNKQDKENDLRESPPQQPNRQVSPSLQDDEDLDKKGKAKQKNL